MQELAPASVSGVGQAREVTANKTAAQEVSRQPGEKSKDDGANPGLPPLFQGQ